VLTEGEGGPLSVLVAPANAHDSTLVGGIIEAVVVERPPVAEHLCLDKGFDTEAAEEAVVGAGYDPHIRRIGEEHKPCEGAQAPAVGGREGHCVAQPVSGVARAVRQEGRELPRPHPTGLCPAVVAEAVQVMW
jgi:hypothetical protein